MSFPGTQPLASSTSWSQCHASPGLLRLFCSEFHLLSGCSEDKANYPPVIPFFPAGVAALGLEMRQRHTCQAGEHKSLPGTFWGCRQCTEGRPEGQESEGGSSWIPVQNTWGHKSFQQLKSFIAEGLHSLSYSPAFEDLPRGFCFPTKFTLPLKGLFESLNPQGY